MSLRPRARVASYTAAELWRRGPDDIPAELVSSTHLIYSSPAALAFNSPGAEGFGVKRAGLSVPGSVMLVVAPGCCGRNTSSVSELPGYEHRFFYLLMSETDLITARHLARIPRAVKAVCESLPDPPSVVMVCITCVDALLGTDMERVCRAAEDLAGVRVRPCYMYALTREGRRPPMVNVRQSIYSLLEPARRDPRSCNLLGHFAPVEQDSDLKGLLERAGVRHVREVGSCATFEDFRDMARANFNLVLNPEAAPAAQDLSERLGIPWIELSRLYQVDRIHSQYEALGSALGVRLDQAPWRERAQDAVRAFGARHAREVFAVGECCNADPFELALALVRYGFGVAEVFGTLAPERFSHLARLAELSPQTRVYSNLEPTMIGYEPDAAVTLTVGRDAGHYHPDRPNLAWNDDVQPFGYTAVIGLFASFERVLSGKAERRGAISLRDERAQDLAAGRSSRPGPRPVRAAGRTVLRQPSLEVKGLRRVLTPFAPDQSGAVSVLFGLGGLSVIVDAGGCTGNVCGFDEPRWFAGADAVFSAGLRDMDAIMGRDDLLVKKLADAAGKIDARFVALVGTPVPAVIGTDLTALRRMSERATGLPAVAVDANGMRLYDAGAERAYRELFLTFADGIRADRGERPAREPGRLGVLGATPMDLSDPGAARALAEALCAAGWRRVTCFGMGASLDDVMSAGAAERNLVVAPSGLAAAKLLKERFGTPYDIDFPLVSALIPPIGWEGRRVLVVHQQVAADALRRELLSRGCADVRCASFFMRPDEVTQPGDVALREEADLRRAVDDMGADVVLADAVLRPLLAGYDGDFFDETHFALSGHLTRLAAVSGT
ncbi:nitrogenase component 1 [Olsenella sp. HMSC062G07]|uniref:nitrogenase component 1 n=1 Tax=Olsenella sp. HMSC062G07 TaxID=1739330 RepID=UPI0008A2EDD1|nr:nitrogenase component 1 [Olsenella sp. HMSC062G07]